MTSWTAELAAYETTAPAAVADMGPVVDCAATETVIGPVLARLAPGWTGSFADLVVTAAEVANPSPDDALGFELVLHRLLGQRQEDRFFSGRAAHRADWPVRRALGDAQDALGTWRQARTGCAGCGQLGERWPTTTSMGIGPSFFIEHWCRDCAPHGVPQVERVLERPDFAALRDRYGKVVPVGSAGSGYTLT